MEALAYDTEERTGREAAPEYERRALRPVETPDPVRRLEERRTELRTQLQIMDPARDDEQARPRFSNHLAEDAQDQQQRQSEAALRHVMLHDLRQVEHALERAATGQYGLCEACGHAIPPRRLQAMPTATMCVQCQGRREMRGVAQ